VVSCFLWSVSVLRGLRGQSLWSVVLRGQSAFFLVVVVSRRGHKFLFVVVVSLRGQSFFVDGVYILWWYAHVFTETHGRENRGQCLDKCTGVGRTRVGGHENRLKPKPNVDYYLVSYLLL